MKTVPLRYRARWRLAKTKGSFRRFGRKIKGLESEGAGVERKRRPGEGTASAPSSHPQGGAGDHGTHWQMGGHCRERGEYLSVSGGTASKQSITLTTASLYRTEKKW